MIIGVRLDILKDKDFNDIKKIYINKEIYKNISLSEYEELSKKPYNYTKVEIDDNYSDCQPCDFNEDLTFNVELYNKRKQSYLNKQKLTELINWFDNYFDKQLNQSLWQNDFIVSADPYFKNENGQPKTYSTIDELKSQAKLVRDEIRELRK